MDENDRRVRRTDKTLAAALSALALEKGYSLVTIRDITERADVAYSTFFRHYHDKDDLLMKMIESGVESLRNLMTQSGGSSAETGGTLLFQHVQENHRFYQVLFSDHGSYRILQQLLDTIAQEMLKTHPLADTGSIPQEIVTNHVVSSVFALIKWWLDHRMPYSAEKMGFVYGELIIKSMERFGGALES